MNKYAKTKRKPDHQYNVTDIPYEHVTIDLRTCKSVLAQPQNLNSNVILNHAFIRGDDEKSLTRPGRKKATTTKPRIYSTHSPRSSIHFLARCSNSCNSHKNKIHKAVRQPGLRGSNDPRVRRKMATFQLLFFSPGNRW